MRATRRESRAPVPCAASKKHVPSVTPEEELPQAPGMPTTGKVAGAWPLC